MLRVVRTSRLPRAPAWLVCIYLAWGAAVALLFTASRALGADVVLCPLRGTTGVPCPMCGGTRAAFHLAALDPLAALALNPLVAVGLPAVALLLAARLVSARTLALETTPPRRRRLRSTALAAASLLLAANWVYVASV